MVSISSFFDLDSRVLLVVAVVLAVLLVQGQKEATVDKAVTFFTVLADSLALLSLQPELLCDCTASKDAPTSPTPV